MACRGRSGSLRAGFSPLIIAGLRRSTLGPGALCPSGGAPFRPAVKRAGAVGRLGRNPFFLRIWSRARPLPVPTPVICYDSLFCLNKPLNLASWDHHCARLPLNEAPVRPPRLGTCSFQWTRSAWGSLGLRGLLCPGGGRSLHFPVRPSRSKGDPAARGVRPRGRQGLTPFPGPSWAPEHSCSQLPQRTAKVRVWPAELERPLQGPGP